jgi:hypothetical protein
MKTAPSRDFKLLVMEGHLNNMGIHMTKALKNLTGYWKLFGDIRNKDFMEI